MTTNDWKSVKWTSGMECTVDRDDGSVLRGEVIGVDFSTKVLRIRPSGKSFLTEWYYYSQVTLDGQQKGTDFRSDKGRRCGRRRKRSEE